MKRLFIGIIGSLFCLAAASAQYPDNGIAPTRTPLSQVEKIALEPVDNEALLREELQSRAPGRAPHFALPIEVDLTPRTHGLWEQLPDGTEVWRLRISSPGAHSLNFGFLEYYMPPGGRLLIYDPGQTRILGPFTPADNESHQQLWTPILAGEEAILEVQLPAGQRKALRLRLATVNHDFLGFLEVLSGACNLDVACGAGDNWAIVEPYREVIQSVAVYGLGGDTFCTGFLVNNTRNDCTPYFMTANHCEVGSSNAPSVVVYWNYQNSTCRQPGSADNGNPGDGQLNNFNSGAIFRAGYAPTDFTLLELDDPLADASQAYFAGWSRDATPPQDTLACVHHADGGEKRISFSFSGAYAGAWGSGGANVPGGNHLIVPHWDVGSTESGSSGGPLFDRQCKVVGQLRGGSASCNNSQYDAFGWFRYSWTGGGTPGTRLKDWLDPDNTNLLFLDGRWLSNCNASISLSNSSQEACIPGSAQYSVEVEEGFLGPVTLSASGLPAGISATFSPNPASPGSAASLTLNIYSSSVPAGNYSFTVRAQNAYNSVEAQATLILTDQRPPALALLAPAAGAEGQALAPAFQWTGHPLAVSYDLQVAADSTFSDIAGSVSGLATPYFQGIVLEPASTYYFRARGRNTCGAGPWSETGVFSTSLILCQNTHYEGPPRVISPQGSSFAVSTIKVTGAGAVAGVILRNIDIAHTYVGDLSAYLQSPSGTVVELFHRPGIPGSFYGCSGANLLLGFSDGAYLSQEELESTCNTHPAISGLFQPINALSSLIGEPADGDWRLTVIDHFDQDGGQINGWELELCTTPPHVARLFPLGNQYLACTGAPYSMNFYVGSGYPGPVNLHLISAPAGAVSSFSSNPAPPGSFVTLRIDSIAQTGNYPLIITGASGPDFHFIQCQLEVEALPTAPTLLLPEDESPVFDDYPTFSWTSVAEADTFLLQIATDPDFQSIVRSARVVTPYYTLESPLSGDIYYWRVSSLNSCGMAESPKAFRFSLPGAVGSQEAGPGQEWLLFPNPTDGLLHLQWTGKAAAERTTVEVFGIEGKRVLGQEFVGNLELSLHGLPAGVYVVVLRNRQGVVVRRVVVR
ncbi:MAG: proprotein convertase P-domain-containing protein [Lewinellaceae bacterium]|nr:proprotein convertase P-domain-containing protein [Phaeodactylibacter sp.]MCB9040254.1 proprotein convertase P-domain-containing protein [Lewinellaceae bacterium]